MSAKCCICGAELNPETAPILYMSGAGIPRCLCDGCSDKAERATKEKNPDDIKAAIDELGKALVDANNDDISVINEVGKIVATAKERCEKIEAGEYDFSLDDEPTEDYEIPEDMLETEEDRALDEAEAKRARIVDTVISWIMGLAIVGAVAFFIIKFIF